MRFVWLYFVAFLGNEATRNKPGFGFVRAHDDGRDSSADCDDYSVSGGKHCDPLSFHYCRSESCSRECRYDSDCQVIENPYKAKANLTLTFFCGKDKLCYGTNKGLRSPCYDDAQCTADYSFCNNDGLCIGGGAEGAPCVNDDHCTSSNAYGYSWCDNDNHVCKQNQDGGKGRSCRDDNHCSVAFSFCNSNDVCAGGGSKGDDCDNDSRCDGDFLFCNSNNECAGGGSKGDDCDNDSRCDGDFLFCNSNNECAGGGSNGDDCRDHGDCDNANSCYNKKCFEVAAGAACEARATCPEDYFCSIDDICVHENNARGASCENDSDCPSDYVCYEDNAEKWCIPRGKADGAICASDNDCTSQVCDPDWKRCSHVGRVKVITPDNCLAWPDLTSVTCNVTDTQQFFYYAPATKYIHSFHEPGKVIHWERSHGNYLKLRDVWTGGARFQQWYWISDTKEWRTFDYHENGGSKVVRRMDGQLQLHSRPSSIGSLEKFYFDEGFFRGGSSLTGHVSIADKGNNWCWSFYQNNDGQDVLNGEPCTYNHNQMFEYDPFTGRIHSLQEGSGKCIRHTNDNEIKIQDCGTCGGDDCRWKRKDGLQFRDDGDGRAYGRIDTARQEGEECASFRTDRNDKIRMEDCSSAVRFQFEWPHGWFLQNHEKVHIKSRVHNKYIRAKPDGRVDLSSGSNAWEEWSIQTDSNGDTVIMSVAHARRYLSARDFSVSGEDGNEVQVRYGTPAAWEKWIVQDAGEDENGERYFYIKSKEFGKYLRGHSDGKVDQAGEGRSSEKWQFVLP